MSENWLGTTSSSLSSSRSKNVSAPTETGILRKNKKFVPDNIELLVFGYQSQIFRDDEKAREIDQGKHLIPWMGGNSLKIDRLIQILDMLKRLFLYDNMI